MGGGNAQKSKMAREKNLEKQKAAAKGNFSLCLSFFRIPQVLGANQNCLTKKEIPLKIIGALCVRT